MESFDGISEIVVGNTKCFYIDGKDKILIDSGLQPLSQEVVNFLIENRKMSFTDEQIAMFKKGAMSTVIDFLNSNRLKVDYIIVTHCHNDHVGNLAALKEEFKVPVAAHKNDIPVIEGLEKLPSPKFLPAELISHFETRPCKIDMPLEDNQSFNEDLKVIHVDGHTKGNISLLFRDRVLIAGDTVLGRNLLNPEETPRDLNPPAEFSCYDYKLAKESLKKLLDFNFDVIFTSHGQSVKKEGKHKLEELIKDLGASS